MKKLILISLCVLFISTMVPEKASAGFGYWDLFSVGLTPNGQYWTLVNGGTGALTDPLVSPDPAGGWVIDNATPLGGVAWGFGGFDWGTGTLEAMGGTHSIQLVGAPAYYLNVALDTKTTPAANGAYPSWGTVSNIVVRPRVAGGWGPPIVLQPANWVLSPLPHDPDGGSAVAATGDSVTMAINQFGSGEFGPPVPPQPMGIWGACYQLPWAAGYKVDFVTNLFTWDSYNLGGTGPPPNIKWQQKPDLEMTGMDVNATYPQVLADDWQCNEEGLVTDIHIWGSWKDDYLPFADPTTGEPGETNTGGDPMAVVFTLSLHSNTPVGPQGWSEPNEWLWGRKFYPGEFTVEPWNTEYEDWYCPCSVPPIYLKANHLMCWKYNFYLKPGEFHQEPGTIYWLNVQAHPNDPCAVFGWKTSVDHWMDDAVWGVGEEPQIDVWTEMLYPPLHQFAGTSIDLAFEITGEDPQNPEPESDLGDAPDSSNSIAGSPPMTAYPAAGVQANYPTVYTAGSPPHGPRHSWPTLVAHLGPNVSFEIEADIGPDNDGVNNILPPAPGTADLDGADDGVFGMPLNLPNCKCTRFKYQVNVINPGTDLWVNAWFDWNRDGDWDDAFTCPTGVADEWAVQNQFLFNLPAGTTDINTPSFLPWHSAGDPNEIWMRITLSEDPWKGGENPAMTGNGGSGPAAAYKYGETEDYYFTVDKSCLRCPDLNCDGIVNLKDLGIMGNKWLQSCP